MNREQKGVKRENKRGKKDIGSQSKVKRKKKKSGCFSLGEEALHKGKVKEKGGEEIDLTIQDCLRRKKEKERVAARSLS